VPPRKVTGTALVNVMTAPEALAGHRLARPGGARFSRTSAPPASHGQWSRTGSLSPTISSPKSSASQEANRTLSGRLVPPWRARHSSPTRWWTGSRPSPTTTRADPAPTIQRPPRGDRDKRAHGVLVQTRAGQDVLPPPRSATAWCWAGSDSAWALVWVEAGWTCDDDAVGPLRDQAAHARDVA